MSPEEAAWIAEAQKGSEAAFGRLVSAYQKPVFGFILGMVREVGTAEELTQTTFLKAWKALPRFRSDAAFQTWLFQIAHNGVRSWGRWQKLRWSRETPLDAPVSVMDPESGTQAEQHRDLREDADPGRQSESAEMKQRIQQAVDRLPAREKEVFTLRHFQDLSVKEVSEIMGIAEGSVKAHLFHAMEKLRNALGESSDEL